MLNALSVDVEDWFQVGAFEGVIRRDQWDGLEQRVERNAQAVIDLFEEAGVKATFFTLGWVAERHPALIRRAAAAGHEIASHGWGPSARLQARRGRLPGRPAPRPCRHRRCRRSRAERLPGAELLDRQADSLGAPRARRGGLCLFLQRRPDRPRPLWLARGAALRPPARCRAPDLIELPVTTVELGGRRMAAGGGGFFRLLPYRFSSWAIGRVNTDDERPAVFYFHPGRSIPDSRGWRGRRSNRGFAIQPAIGDALQAVETVQRSRLGPNRPRGRAGA
jgi:hypothetical protein